MKPDNDATPQPRIELRDYEVTVPTMDGQNIACKVALKVPMEWDDTIDDWLLTPEAMLEIENTKARHMGLLLPDEIRALREQLNKTQAEMAELLDIGDKTWTLWENGIRRPSQSLNKLLKALQAEANWAAKFGGFSPLFMLADLKPPEINWVEAIEASLKKPKPVAPKLEETELPINYEEMALAA